MELTVGLLRLRWFVLDWLIPSKQYKRLRVKSNTQCMRLTITAAVSRSVRVVSSRTWGRQQCFSLPRETDRTEVEFAPVPFSELRWPWGFEQALLS